MNEIQEQTTNKDGLPNAGDKSNKEQKKKRIAIKSWGARLNVDNGSANMRQSH